VIRDIWNLNMGVFYQLKDKFDHCAETNFLMKTEILMTSG